MGDQGHDDGVPHVRECEENSGDARSAAVTRRIFGAAEAAI